MDKLIVELTVCVLSLTFFIAWYSKAITQWPTCISKIGGSEPAYYVFAPGMTVVSLCLFYHLYFLQQYTVWICSPVCLSLAALAIFDYYRYHFLHGLFSLIFFTSSIVLIFPFVFSMASCCIAFSSFIISICSDLCFEYMMTSKTSAVFQWTCVVSLLVSLPFLPTNSV